MRLVKKSKKKIKELGMTLEEAKNSIEQLKENFFNVSSEISVAGQNEDRVQILNLIDQLKKIEQQVKEHEEFIRIREENPEQYQMLMW
jgi:predicted transposase YbfD/YdcC